jgi:hypothetical protein
LQNTAVFKPTGNEGVITAFVENSSFDGCATGGDDVNIGINIAGTFNIVQNHRFVNNAPYAAYIDDFGASYKTTDIVFKTLYISNPFRGANYYDPAIFLSQSDIRNISVEATSYFSVINKWIDETASQQTFYKADRDITFVGTSISNFKSFSSISLNDDKAGYFTIDINKSNFGSILISGNTATSEYGIAVYRAGDASAFGVSLVGSANFAVTTGQLTGTTGVNGKLTFSPDTANMRLYVENRTGTTRVYNITNFGNSVITGFIPV